jgi:hypothetical protein
LADEGFEGVVQAVDPFLDVGLAVISPGEDVGDPDGDEPAVGEAQVEGMWREMAVEDLGQAESDQEGQQQGDVVDTFVGEFQDGVHGGTPTRAGRKASLYRRGRPGRKIQAKEREHGHAAQDGPRYNCRFSKHLIRESRVDSDVLPAVVDEALDEPERMLGLGPDPDRVAPLAVNLELPMAYMNAPPLA